MIRSNYDKTAVGVFTRIWGKQRSKSKERGHPMPEYSKVWMINWCYEQGFDVIFRLWVASGYDKNMKPSIDRLDDSIPYTKNNIQMVVWYINNHKPLSYVKTSVVKVKTILCYDLEDKVIGSYVTLQEAADDNSCSINSVVTSLKGHTLKKFAFKFRRVVKKGV